MTAATLAPDDRVDPALVPAYLERIRYNGSTTPTLETLRGMHRAHFFSVPFENLDILAGTPIRVDGAVNYAKIVGARRGGFCLEITGMFARVLRTMGFSVDVMGGRVFADGHLSPPLSHMALVVHLEEDWIADVGFGGALIEPLRMAERGEQRFDPRSYVVSNDGDHWFVTCNEAGTPSRTYTFALQPREFSEFNEVCEWLQTSPDSRFTQGEIVSIGTAEGRVSLAGPRLIETTSAERTETEVASAERDQVLRERFGLEL